MDDLANLAIRLGGGDRRSTGAAGAIAAEVGSDPRAFRLLIEALGLSDPLVRMRAADAAEKVSKRFPTLLEPHRAALLAMLPVEAQTEVQWHLAQMIVRFPLSNSEANAAFVALVPLTRSRNLFVASAALEACADLAVAHPELDPRFDPLLQDALTSNRKSLQACARRLARCVPAS